MIDEIYTRNPYYGTRRMVKELEDYGLFVGRDKIRSCYKLLGLEAIYPKPNLSKNGSEHKIYPYLLRHLPIKTVNQVWSADITYSAPGLSLGVSLMLGTSNNGMHRVGNGNMTATTYLVA
ncbi:MAG: transposase [Microcystis sp. M122S2]|nr:transposase [Microcystis sp. M122S2]